MLTLLLIVCGAGAFIGITLTGMLILKARRG